MEAGDEGSQRLDWPTSSHLFLHPLLARTLLGGPQCGYMVIPPELHRFVLFVDPLIHMLPRW